MVFTLCVPEGTNVSVKKRPETCGDSAAAAPKTHRVSFSTQDVVIGVSDPVALSAEQQEHAALSAEQQEHAALSAEQQEHAALSGEQQEHAALSGEQQEHAALSGEQQEHAALSGEQQGHAALSGEQQEHTAPCTVVTPFDQTSCQRISSFGVDGDSSVPGGTETRTQSSPEVLDSLERVSEGKSSILDEKSILTGDPADIDPEKMADADLQNKLESTASNIELKNEASTLIDQSETTDDNSRVLDTAAHQHKTTSTACSNSGLSGVTAASSAAASAGGDSGGVGTRTAAIVAEDSSVGETAVTCDNRVATAAGSDNSIGCDGSNGSSAATTVAPGDITISETVTVTGAGRAAAVDGASKAAAVDSASRAAAVDGASRAETVSSSPPQVSVREWVYGPGNTYQQPVLTPALPLSWPVPTVNRLWFG